MGCFQAVDFLCAFMRPFSETSMKCGRNSPTEKSEFIAVCRRSTVVSMGTRRSRGGSPLCRRWALQRRGDTQRLSQILRATQWDKLSGADFDLKEEKERRD